MKVFVIAGIFLVTAVVGCSDDDVAGDRAVARVPIDSEGTNKDVTQPSAGTARHRTPRDERRQPKHLNSPRGRRYAGLSLDEWRQRMKDLDPLSPESAAAVPGLIELVKDRDLPWFTRRQAALILGRMGPRGRAAIPLLVEFLQETTGQADVPTRLWAAKALALFGPEAKSAAPVLNRLMRDQTQPISHRQAMIEVLARIGTAHADVVPGLIEVLTNQSRNVSKTAEERALREAATDGIAMIGPAAATAIPALIRATRDPNETLRRKSVAALGAMGARAEIAIAALAESMALDESPAVRDSAVEALAKVGPAAIAVLKRLIQDREAERRWRAAESLGRMGSAAKPATALLTQALDDKHALVRITAVEALWKITADAKRIMPALILELTNEDRRIRIRAFRLITRMGPQAHTAVEPLKKLLKDERSSVRQTASKALQMIHRGQK